MKFGKEFRSQMVPEWQEAYMNYNYLKGILKDMMNTRQRNKPLLVSTKSPSLYRAFSGLTSRYASFKGGFSNVKDKEDEVILVSAGHPEEEEGGGSEANYQTIFLRSSDVGGEYELVFFKRLDDEFNKVVKFYKAKVKDAMEEAQCLTKQMDALVALRFKIYYPDAASATCPVSNSHSMSANKTGSLHLDVIQETEMNEVGDSYDQVGPTSGDLKRNSDLGNGDKEDYRLASTEVLNQAKINVERATLVRTLKNVWNGLKADSSCSKEELRTIEKQMKNAFIEFHKKLRLLKNYSFLNQLAFSKIMKKYDKITSRHASEAYLHMVDKSYLGQADEVANLIERVEAAVIKHLSNGNRNKGMNTLRPKYKRERHRETFFLGFFSGCSVALVVAIILAVHTKNVLREGRVRYMDTVFQLYSLFGYVVLHMLMYSGNIYFWKRYRVNYSFIIGFKPGTELGYREVLLVTSGLALLTLAGVLSNLEMDIDPSTESFKALTELVPLALAIIVLLILICPFNIVYRTNRVFLLQCIWHCACAPLYKVTLPDFFLADQLTSQVQSLRGVEYYVCYYVGGGFKTRSTSCPRNNVFRILSIFVGVIPYWMRFLQCLRRLYEERDSMQGVNGLKYFSIIVAVVTRTIYGQRRGMTLRIIAAFTSGVATIFNLYWDLVIDWGLLCRDSENPWLRDKLLVPNKFVYFAAMVLNALLRLVWMQAILDFNEAPFLHGNAIIAIVASLEIIRRGIWNFFRLENEHLNNVGKYRAFKSVPLPFSYEDEDKDE